MSKDIRTGRRRFLQGAGVGGAALLAGCSALDSDSSDNGVDDTGNGDDGNGDDGNGDDTGNGNGDPTGDDREVAAVPGFSEELEAEFEAELDELNEDVEAGEIPQEEAFQMQQQIQAEYQELSFDELVVLIGETDTIALEEELDEFGAVRITATADALLDFLENPEVEAIASVDVLDQPDPAEEP